LGQLYFLVTRALPPAVGSLEEVAMNMPGTYAVYLAVSIGFTIWVARTLHHHGRAFLVVCFGCQEKLADAVNGLLVVGFYLVNLAYVALALRYGTKPRDFTESLEFLGTKIGLVLLILGTMHLGNLAFFAWLRRRRERKPPVRISPARSMFPWNTSAFFSPPRSDH
jgi:hypothetical protein